MAEIGLADRPTRLRDRIGVALSRRLLPRSGRLTLLLLAAVCAVLVEAVVATDWTHELTLLRGAAVGSLCITALLASSQAPLWRAALIDAAYAVLFAVLRVGRLIPPVSVWAEGWDPAAEQMRQQAALFVDRIAGWQRAVSAGQQSRDTLVFTLLVLLIGWALTAGLTWQTVRARRPLPMLLVAALTLATAVYFSAAPVGWLALLLGAGALLVADCRHAELEQSWQARQIDYSTEIRRDMLLSAVVAALYVTGLAYFAAQIDAHNTFSRLVARSTAVQTAERTLERAFGGVQTTAQIGEQGLGAGRGDAGLLPRSHLLGAPPELTQAVVMTAVVEGVPPPGVHWRAVSYDRYTGRGWERSDTRSDRWPAGEPLPLPAVRASLALTQTVNWVADERRVRYALGLPEQFDQPVTAFWRGLDDLVYVEGSAVGAYTVRSRVSAATPAQLDAARREDAPSAVRARYTQLPDDLSPRLRELAARITAEAATPYRQALAVEQFLHQYRYDLAIPPPPANRELVDYFLFDAQVGYCDYFATAMVVLARLNGLPARLATGYLSGAPDGEGALVVRGRDAHSWAEVYFGGYGWVEFEPTTPFAVAREALPDAPEAAAATAPVVVVPPRPVRPAPWRPLLVGAALAVARLLYALQQRRRHRPSAPLERSYARLQADALRLGAPPSPAQTPLEFGQALGRRLEELARDPRVQGNARLARRVADLQEQAQAVVQAFTLRRYGGAAHTAAPPPTYRPSRALWVLRRLHSGRLRS